VVAAPARAVPVEKRRVVLAVAMYLGGKYDFLAVALSLADRPPFRRQMPTEKVDC